MTATARALVAPPRLAGSVAALTAALSVAVLAVVFAGDTAGTAVDGWARSAWTDPGSPWRQVALVVDYTAEPVGGALTLATLVVVCVTLGDRRAALLAVLGTGASVATTTLLKPVVGREINGGFLAFPSGHTATATALGLVVALVVVRRRRLAAPTGTLLVVGLTGAAGAAMAWSQVTLNAHYLTDTVGGFGVAVAVVPTVAWLVDRLADRGQRGRT